MKDQHESKALIAELSELSDKESIARNKLLFLESRVRHAAEAPKAAFPGVSMPQTISRAIYDGLLSALDDEAFRAWEEARDVELADARNEAIEEAARLVDDATPPPDHGVLYIVRENMGLLAKAIRSLSSKPAGGNDGK